MVGMLHRAGRAAARWLAGGDGCGTWAEARGRCGLGYEDAEIVGVVAAKTRGVVEGRVAPSDWDYRLARAFIDAGVPGRVFDFGGACGASYFQLRKMFLASGTEWYVGDTAAMVRAGRVGFEGARGRGGLWFVDDFPDKDFGVDLVVASGAIQFVNPQREIVRRILAVGAAHVYFSRLHLIKSGEPVIDIQELMLSENGPGELPQGFEDKVVRYPRVAYPESWFLKVIAEAGYKELWRVESGGKLHAVFLQRSGG